jgi:hypothetical protein
VSKKTPSTKRRGDWFTVKEAAGFLGISQQAFRAGWLPDLDAADVRPGRPATVFGPAVLELAIERAAPAGGLDAMGIPIAASDSPATERWRRARALEVETKVLERLGELESVAVTRNVVESIARPIRDFARRAILDGRIDAGEWTEVIAMAERELLCLHPPTVVRRSLHVLLVGEEHEIVVDLTLLGNEENK